MLLCVRTFEEQPLSSFKEFVLYFSVHDRIKSSDTDYLLDTIPTAIICIRVCPENTTEKGLQPERIRSNSLVATLINAVAFDSARDLDLYAHIQPRKGIVAAVKASVDTLDLFSLSPNQYKPEITFWVLSFGA